MRMKSSWTSNVSPPVSLQRQYQPLLLLKISGLNSALQHINRQLANHPANANALVLFSLNSCPNEVFQTDWHATKPINIAGFIKEQVNVPVCQVDHALYVALFQAESTHVTNSLLIGLNSSVKTAVTSRNWELYIPSSPKTGLQWACPANCGWSQFWTDPDQGILTWFANHW